MSDEQKEQEQPPKQEPPSDDNTQKTSKPPIEWPKKTPYKNRITSSKDEDVEDS